MGSIVSDAASYVENVPRPAAKPSTTEETYLVPPASLARILARLAILAKEDLPETFDAVSSLRDDYDEALGLRFDGQEGIDFFRSSLVQTAFYGLFAGWTVWLREGDGRAFTWDEMDRYIKVPFLGSLFRDFRHPDRLAELHLAEHLDRATAVLQRLERQSFFKHFHYHTLALESGSTGDGSALTYFYEPFLEAFDPGLRKALGVWYTPADIVRYQVRRIDRLLREDLGCAHGFADDRVLVLDPCCGTGAYLLEVIRSIADDIRARGDHASLGTEIVEAITKRIIGFEILTAPFVVAQLQIYLLLSDLKVTLKKGDRPAIFLTNALTGWGAAEQVKLNFPELQKERELATGVKRGAKIIVVLGNPPYNRFVGAAIDEEADLVDKYKGIKRKPKLTRKKEQTLDEHGRPVMLQDGPSALYTRWGVRKQLLDDLYIRFFRLAEERIGEHAEYGVVSFISNSSYLTGRSHPIMRESLLKSFQRIWIDNMNGDKYRTGKIVPDGVPGAGSADQSIFTTQRDARGIQVGVCVTTMLKRKKQPAGTQEVCVSYRDFWGKAAAKRRALLASLEMADWTKEKRLQAAATPEGPREYEVLAPSEERRWLLSPRTVVAGYEAWPAIDELFPTSYQGINPNRGLEGSLIDTDKNILHERMKDYFTKPRFEDVRKAHPELVAKRARYEPREVWRELRATSKFATDHIVRYLVFPLDLRWIYYEDKAKLLNERRPGFWENLGGNEFFLTVPQPRKRSETRALLATTLVNLHVHDRGAVCFPKHVKDGTLISAPMANLARSAWKALRDAWKLSGELSDAAAIQMTGDLFRVALATMHAPDYQDEHADSLRQDWAHVPIPRSRETFDELARLGQTVATLLDASADPTAAIISILGATRAKVLGVMTRRDGAQIPHEGELVTVAYFGAAKGRWIPRPFEPEELAHECWGKETGDLELNEVFLFTNVPAAAWRFELGGYPVLRKWLGYRQASHRANKPVTLTELRAFRQVIHRIAALAALGPELNAAFAAADADAFTAEELGLPR